MWLTGYYRVTLPLDALKAEGWKVGYRAGTPPPEAENAKVIVGQRLDRPEVMGHWRRLALRAKLVYELDDDVFAIEPINWLAYRVYSRGDVLDAVGHCAEVADAVTVSTEPLAERMRQFSDNVTVLPNFIPEYMLKIERPHYPKLTVGWTGGASHGYDVKVCASAVRKVLDTDVKDATLHLQGSDFRGSFGHSGARFTNWAAKPADYYYMLDFDVGLAPLVDSEFNRSKSYIKCLEYNALGIPVIASDVEPYSRYVIDGVNGFLARKEKDWRDRLRLLLSDHQLREEMGAKAREHAAGFTMEANCHRWAEVYQGLVALRPLPVVCGDVALQLSPGERITGPCAEHLAGELRE